MIKQLESTNNSPEHVAMTVSIDKIFRKLSDDKSLVLFNTIAISGGQNDIQISNVGLTTKQYYSRISGLTNAGLVKRHTVDTLLLC